jgi:hypothetical protein
MGWQNTEDVTKLTRVKYIFYKYLDRNNALLEVKIDIVIDLRTCIKKRKSKP